MAARHDLEGQCGLKWEEVFWDSTPNTLPCRCGKPTCTAELSFNWGGSSLAAEQSLGTVYFINVKTGEKMVAGSTRAKTPPGWTRHTTTSYHETQVLERSLRAQDFEKSTIARESMQGMEELRESMERAAWRADSTEANLIAAARAEREQRQQNEREEFGDTTYRPKIQDDAARARLARDYAQAAQEELYKRGRKWGGVDTGVHIGALHYDERKR